MRGAGRWCEGRNDKMEKITEKFNVFDIFSMMIPGIGILMIFCISFSPVYYNTWKEIGGEKYVVYLIVAYFCGILYHEIGTILDKLVINKLLYTGKIREIFLLENGHKEIFAEDLYFQDALFIRDYFIKNLKIEMPRHMTQQEEKEFNSVIYGYSLNLIEKLKLNQKSEKMIAISEMSRSMFWGCISGAFLDVVMFFLLGQSSFYLLNSIFLLVVSLIFLRRKKRYELYRIRINIRELVLYIKFGNLKEAI